MKKNVLSLLLITSVSFSFAQKNDVLKNGVVIVYDTTDRRLTKDSALYVKGAKMVYAISSFFMNGQPLDYYFVDSLKDIAIYKVYDSATNKLTVDGYYKKGSGTLTTDMKFKLITRPVVSREFREAGFPGGKAGWIGFIRQNLNPNVPVQKKAKAGVYKVIARFIVNEDGSLADIKAETDFGHGMEKEVIRMLKSSPNWEPALILGLPVKAYRRQPITFVVSDE